MLHVLTLLKLIHQKLSGWLSNENANGNNSEIAEEEKNSQFDTMHLTKQAVEVLLLIYTKTSSKS